MFILFNIISSIGRFFFSEDNDDAVPAMDLAYANVVSTPKFF